MNRIHGSSSERGRNLLMTKHPIGPPIRYDEAELDTSSEKRMIEDGIDAQIIKKSKRDSL